MPKKAQASRAKPAKAGKPKAAVKRASRVAVAAVDQRASVASRRFVADLLVRGEAQPRDAQGKVPLRATHVVEKQNPDGTAKVRRVRFKLY